MLLLCLGCNKQHGYADTFQRAEQLSDVGMADSALVVLDSIRKSGVEDRRDAMHLDLITIKAKDKAYITPENDSIIKTLLYYYIDCNRERELHPKVLYYAGRVYSEMMNYPLALDYFRRSLDLLPEDGEYYDFKSRIHAQMAGLFHYCGLNTRAKWHFKKELELEKALDDTASMINTNLQVAFTHTLLNERDSALMIYDMVKSLEEQYGDSILHSLFLTQLMFFYTRGKEFEKADSIYVHNHIKWDKVRTNSVLSTLSTVLMWRKDYDMVEKISPLLIDNSNIEVRLRIINYLGRIYMEKGDFHRAMEYMDEYINLTDSIEHKSNNIELMQIEAIYDYKEKEEQINCLRNRKYTTILLIAIGLLIIALLAMGLITIKKRNILRLAQKESENLKLEGRYNQLLTEKDILREHQNEKLNKINNDIKSHKELLIELVDKYEKLKESSAEILRSKDLELATAESILINIEMKLKKQEQQEKESVARRIITDLTYKFMEEAFSINRGIKEEDFDALKEALFIIYPEFINAIDKFGLKERDERDAMMIRINIPLKACSNILNTSQQSLSNIRNRLHGKYCNGYTTRNWGDFIRSL